jgi:hypothetical protein
MPVELNSEDGGKKANNKSNKRRFQKLYWPD